MPEPRRVIGTSRGVMLVSRHAVLASRGVILGAGRRGMLWPDPISMQLQPVHPTGTSRRLAALAIGALGGAIVLAAWLGAHPLTRSQAAASGGLPLTFTHPLAGAVVPVAGPVAVLGHGALPGATVCLTASDGHAATVTADARGAFAAQVPFLAPTGPQGVRVEAWVRPASPPDGGDGLDPGSASCGSAVGSGLVSVAFTLLPGADVSIWDPAGPKLIGPPFVVSGATAGAIPEVRVRLEAPDGSLIDDRTVPTLQVGDGDHAFRSPPLAVERSDLGPAVLIVTWIDPRTEVQAPELAEPVNLVGSAMVASQP